MKRTLIGLALAFAALGGAASAATCADRAHVVKQLEERFGETLYANAMSSTQDVLEVFASPEGESWTVLVFLPERNLSCLAASGNGLDELALVLEK